MPSPLSSSVIARRLSPWSRGREIRRTIGAVSGSGSSCCGSSPLIAQRHPERGGGRVVPRKTLVLPSRLRIASLYITLFLQPKLVLKPGKDTTFRPRLFHPHPSRLHCDYSRPFTGKRCIHLACVYSDVIVLVEPSPGHIANILIWIRQGVRRLRPPTSAKRRGFLSRCDLNRIRIAPRE